MLKGAECLSRLPLSLGLLQLVHSTDLCFSEIFELSVVVIIFLPLIFNGRLRGEGTVMGCKVAIDFLFLSLSLSLL